MLPGVSVSGCAKQHEADNYRNPFDRPTADVLLSQHPFCDLDPNYNFYDTALYQKIKHAYNKQ